MKKTYFNEANNETNEVIDEMIANETTEAEVAPTKVRKASGKAKTGRVTSRYVYVRVRAAANAGVVLTLKFGDNVKVLDRVDGFYKVEVDRPDSKKSPVVGYVASTFLEEV